MAAHESDPELVYKGLEGAGRVLVVDDEPHVLQLMQAILEGSFSLAMVSTAEDALPYLERACPDVVVADKNLPGMSGIDLLQQTRKICPGVEVIIITAYASLESAIEALRMGAYDYVLKPFPDIRIVAEKVERAYEKQRLVAERELFQRALQESEDVHRSLVETSADAIALIDLDGKVLQANEEAARLLGLGSAEELKNRSGFDFIPRVGHGLARANLSTYRESALVREAEETVVRADGSQVQISFSLSMIRDADGQPKSLVVIARDMTERKQMQASLAQNDRMASVGTLAAGVAHEINNPLAYVLYNLDSLATDIPKVAEILNRCRLDVARELGDDRASEVFGPIWNLFDQGLLEDMQARAEEGAQGARRARDIVRDLKTFSRVEEDRRVPVTIKQVIESAINMAYNEIKYRARLVKEYGQVPAVLASEGRLSQVFLNLLVNAAQAIEEGQVDRNEIRVRTWVENGEVCTEVRDTGTGITPNNLEHIFKPFHTTKEIGRGSGLGLSICQNIVTSYGGRIDVRSKMGEGTRFVVRLPVPAREPLTEPVTPAESADVATGRRGRILVIDDEPLIGATIHRVLRSEHDVVVASSGPEGKKTLEENPAFDLIICDLMMPDVTGMDIHAWLEQAHPEVAGRMMFITGGAFTPKANQFLERVKNLHVEKPFDPKNLRTLVHNMLNPPGKVAAP